MRSKILEINVFFNGTNRSYPQTTVAIGAWFVDKIILIKV